MMPENLEELDKLKRQVDKLLELMSINGPINSSRCKEIIAIINGYSSWEDAEDLLNNYIFLGKVEKEKIYNPFFIYKIVYDRKSEELHAIITDYLNDGWKLYGNPFIDKDNNYHQALTKEINQ